MSLHLDRLRRRRQPLSGREIREAVDDLVRRGVVDRIVDDKGVERFAFPDRETGDRLLKESREGGQ
jgi:hypothetical protein